MQHSRLQLCDANSAGSVRCNYRGGGCAGAAETNCYPYIVWSASAQSTGVYYSPEFNGSSIKFYQACGTGYCPVSYAFSVRCLFWHSCITKLPQESFLHCVFMDLNKQMSFKKTMFYRHCNIKLNILLQR